MATRIGKYLFEDDFEGMDVDKLKALRDGCEFFIKEKHREEIHRELTRINLLAHTYGFDICVRDGSDYPLVMDENTLAIAFHEDIEKLYNDN